MASKNRGHWTNLLVATIWGASCLWWLVFPFITAASPEKGTLSIVIGSLSGFMSLAYIGLYYQPR